MANILENGMRTPQYQMNGARRAAALGLTPPPGIKPTQPLGANARQGMLPGLPTGSDPTPAPPSNYDQLFRASIDAQRGQIDAQLRSAMGALAQREQAAQGLVARQPGEVNANYDAAAPALGALRKTAEDTQGQLHVQSLDAPGAAMNPIIAAVAGDRAARLSDQPYLQAGTGEIFTRQRGALDQAGMAAKGDLESKMSDYLQQNALQAAQAKQQEDSFYQHTLFQHDLNAQDQQAATQAKRAEENRMLDASEPPPGTPEWWKWNMQRHPNQAQDFTSRQGGAFANARRLLTQGEWQGPPTESVGPLVGPAQMAGMNRNKLTMQQVLQRFKGPKYARLRAALLYQRPH